MGTHAHPGYPVPNLAKFGVREGGAAARELVLIRKLDSIANFLIRIKNLPKLTSPEDEDLNLLLNLFSIHHMSLFSRFTRFAPELEIHEPSINLE